MTDGRLLALLSYVTSSDVVGDIGSDHGLIPRYLIKNGHSYVYASDNKIGPYRRLKTALSDLPSGSAEVALQDGIFNLPPRVNTLLISGMGGQLIVEILTKYPDALHNVKKLILGPQGAEKEVRLALGTLGFMITAEEIVKADKYYEIIVGERGKATYDTFKATFGPLNLKTQSAPFRAKWTEIRAQRLDILKNITLNEIRRHELEGEIQAINRALTEEK